MHILLLLLCGSLNMGYDFSAVNQQLINLANQDKIQLVKKS